MNELIGLRRRLEEKVQAPGDSDRKDGTAGR